MNDFLKFLDKKLQDFPMHVEITYNKTCDWCHSYFSYALWDKLDCDLRPY